MLGHGRTHPSHVDHQPELPASGRPTKKQKREARLPYAPAPPPATPKGGGKGKGKGKDNGKGHPKKGPGNQYITDRQGSQICFDWARKAGGCTTGQCPQRRAHVCETCLQAHRTIDHKNGEGGKQDGGARHS